MTTMDERRLLMILETMMADFKSDLAEMRSAGVTQVEIDAMLDAFERIYAPHDDVEGKLVMDVLRHAALPRD